MSPIDKFIWEAGDVIFTPETPEELARRAKAIAKWSKKANADLAAARRRIAARKARDAKGSQES